MREEIERYTAQLLDITRFRDYCPNGLQVEGRNQIKQIVSGVSASMRLLEEAVAVNADAVLVHHGYFWRNEAPQVTGIKKQRLAFLLSHDINLFAYHLPLDAHPELGNNVQLAKRLMLNLEGWCGEQNLIAYGAPAQTLALGDFVKQVEDKLARKPTVIGDPRKQIKRVAWCTGGAQGYLEEAVRLQVDAYLTGEISEHNVHIAAESGVAFISAGHHATERYGVQALGEHLATKFGISHRFIDIDNPV